MNVSSYHFSESFFDSIAKPRSCFDLEAQVDFGVDFVHVLSSRSARSVVG